MTTYTQYIVPCVTESIGVVTGYVATVPTVCPNNNTHTIDPTGIRAIGNLNSKTVVVNQTPDITAIGNNYCAQTYNINALASSVTNLDITFPYNTVIYLATYLGNAANIGDSLDVVAAPNGTTGILAADIASGVTTLTISPIVNVPSVGWLLNITDGVNTDQLGPILSVNIATGVLTFLTATVNSFLAGSTVRITIQRVKNLQFANEQNIIVGFNKIKTTVLPANKIIRFMYTNNGVVDKQFSFLLEIGY